MMYGSEASLASTFATALSASSYSSSQSQPKKWVDLESNDFARLFEVREIASEFLAVELSNDSTDMKRIVVSKTQVDSVRLGDVLVAVSGRFLPPNTPASDVLKQCENSGRETSTMFRFWRVETSVIIGRKKLETSDDSSSSSSTSGTSSLDVAMERNNVVQKIGGREFAPRVSRRRILGTKWGRIQLTFGSLELVRYFVAFRSKDAEEDARQGQRRHDDDDDVHRGDILIGIDHEPLPILITSSDLQYRLNRGTAIKPITLNVFRINDVNYLNRVRTSCDIADSSAGYYYRQQHHQPRFFQCNDLASRCPGTKCEGSAANTCMCLI